MADNSMIYTIRDGLVELSDTQNTMWILVFNCNERLTIRHSWTGDRMAQASAWKLPLWLDLA